MSLFFLPYSVTPFRAFMAAVLPQQATPTVMVFLNQRPVGRLNVSIGGRVLFIGE